MCEEKFFFPHDDVLLDDGLKDELRAELAQQLANLDVQLKTLIGRVSTEQGETHEAHAASFKDGLACMETQLRNEIAATSKEHNTKRDASSGDDRDRECDNNHDHNHGHGHDHDHCRSPNAVWRESDAAI